MNNRIKSLLAEAHLSVENAKDTNKIAETFAELIIQECCTVMNQYDSYYGEVMMSPLIRKHFGLE